MKRLTFLCVAVMVTAALIFSSETSFSQVYQLENPGFEQWDGGSNDEPTGWNSYPSANCTISGIINIGGVACSTAKSKRHEKSTDVRPDATGDYSCKIYSTSALGFIANGALTSGQMQLAEADMSSTANGNRTLSTNEEFNHRLNAKPDSIVFWAKVVNASNTDSACCHLYIHDDYDLQDPLTGNSSGYENHIVGAVPAYNFTNNGSTWQRHSTPILYDDYENDDPQFVLITFSTNAIPGGGAANDALYIDDIEFIYNPIRHEFSETACGSFTWDGSTYNESGDYVKTYEGTPRDSIVTLHLTINNSVTNEITETAENSFTWNNQEYTTSGDYTQTFDAANGCDSVVTLHLTINTTGIDENEIAGINVYPNPAKDRINIEGAEIKSVSVCDIAGREIAEYKNNGESTMNISTEMLESGNYMLVIRSNDGSTTTRRIAIIK